MSAALLAGSSAHQRRAGASSLQRMCTAFASTARQLSRTWFRVRATLAHELLQRRIQWVLRIRSIEPLVTVAPAGNKVRRLELGDFILDRSQCEKTAPRQLARIQLVVAFCKQQSQHFGPHDRKQSMQQALFDAATLTSNALSSQVYKRAGRIGRNGPAESGAGGAEAR